MRTSTSTGIFRGKTWTRRTADEPPTPQFKWNANNRDKVRAHGIVRNALLKGEIRRGKCEICGSLRTDAHHDRYDRPLEIRWLCRQHHQQHHAALRRASA